MIRRKKRAQIAEDKMKFLYPFKLIQSVKFAYELYVIGLRDAEKTKL